MKSIYVKGIGIQFDSKGDAPVKEAQDMIDKINEVLQREFPDSQPQVMGVEAIDFSDIETEDSLNEEEESGE
jgi:hypothetical protein